MLAKRRNMRVNGLINIPRISTGVRINDLDDRRNTWHPHDMTPVVFVSIDRHHDKGDQRKTAVTARLPGDVASPKNGNLTKKIQAENKEKERKQ